MFAAMRIGDDSTEVRLADLNDAGSVLRKSCQLCFVTGTDTGVGKTAISAALLHHLAQRGLRCAGFKPVAAGTSLIRGKTLNDDVVSLQLASSIELTADEVGPYQFETACAPHIAAQLENRRIDRIALQKAAGALSQRADYLVIEGAGGFCVPLSPPNENPGWNTADLAWDMTEGGRWPVVMVVGLRLGCINHALLTAQAIAARGLKLAAWVANSIEPDLPYNAEVINCLQKALGAQCGAELLGVVPWLAVAHAASVSPFLDLIGVCHLFDLEKPPVQNSL
jgi:dethiobiotin synthetase